MRKSLSRRKLLKGSVTGLVAASACGGTADFEPASERTAPGTEPDSSSSQGPVVSDASTRTGTGGATSPDAASAPADAAGASTGSPDAGPVVTMEDPAVPPPATGATRIAHRILGKTGVMVPVIAFGGGERYLEAPEAEAERLIHRAIELGVTYFDTAWNYGEQQASQKRYGRLLTPTYRKDIFLVSKTDQRTAEGAKRQLDQTLTNLKTDRLDVLHFHHIDGKADVDQILAPNGAYQVFQKAKEEGVIRFIGLTGHSTGAILLDALKRIKPDVYMAPQNGARESGFTDLTVPYAQEQGIGILGMKVTAKDILVRKGLTPEDLLRYSLSLPIATMIVGMSSLAVLESCVRVARDFTALPATEMTRINRTLAFARIFRQTPYMARGYRDGAGRTRFA